MLVCVEKWQHSALKAQVDLRRDLHPMQFHRNSTKREGDRTTPFRATKRHLNKSKSRNTTYLTKYGNPKKCHIRFWERRRHWCPPKWIREPLQPDPMIHLLHYQCRPVILSNCFFGISVAVLRNGFEHTRTLRLCEVQLPTKTYSRNREQTILLRTGLWG